MMCRWPAAINAWWIGANFTNCGRAPTTLSIFMVTVQQ
jgi:hypothetical protein